MVGFTEVFGGSNIYPSQPTYLALDPLTTDVDLQWPIEQAIAGDLVVADIIDVNATAPGLTIMMPDARQASEGFTSLINNIGANTVDILAADGSNIVSIVAGSVWQIYLTDNTTEAGTWRIFQFGASVSVAVASALAGAGLKAISTTLNERMIVVARNVNYNIVDADRANVQQWVSGVGTFTLPDPASVGNDWFTVIKNQGNGNLTINTVAGLIDGNATLVLAPGQSCWILTDGANYFSLVGAGSSGSGSGFNLITIDVSGTGNFVLVGGQLNQIGYKFVGVLTGNRAIIVPNTIAEYWVDNETTGAFNLTVGTLGQVSPINVPQGNRNILYSDGANVVSAESAAVVFPITIGQGGTGATTAANARTNLGATTVGNAVFTAASPGAAQAALAVPPVGRLINTAPTALLSGGGDLSTDRTITLNFVGATVFASAGFVGAPGGSFIAWDSEAIDQGAWHDPVTNNSRLTVPAGISVAEIRASLELVTSVNNNGNWNLDVVIWKNGATLIVEQLFQNIVTSITAQNKFSLNIDTGPIPVAPGDFFQVQLSGSDGGGVNHWNLANLGQLAGNFSARALG